MHTDTATNTQAQRDGAWALIAADVMQDIQDIPKDTMIFCIQQDPMMGIRWVGMRDGYMACGPLPTVSTHLGAEGIPLTYRNIAGPEGPYTPTVWSLPIHTMVQDIHP